MALARGRTLSADEHRGRGTPTARTRTRKEKPQAKCVTAARPNPPRVGSVLVRIDSVCAEMNVFLVFVSVAVFEGAVLLCEGKVRRQIWPAPGNPFWGPNDGGLDFQGPQDFWAGPPRFDRPIQNQNNFLDGFIPGGGRNEWNSNGGRGQNGGDSERDRGRRTTTENLGPITSTPATVHTAPQGCQCPMTQQFNPVCGTDGNTYRNMGLLNCYKRCGTNVSQKRLGRC